MSNTMIQEEAMNMSNEQAVQILIPMRNMMCDQHGCPISDAVFALDKAIEVLSVDRPIWLKTEIVEEYDGLHPDGITKVKSNTTKREKEMFEYGYKCGMNDSDRPQGEWTVNNYKSVCSVCGANETDFIYGTEMWYGLGESKFCPNCGAQMKGADDDSKRD